MKKFTLIIILFLTFAKIAWAADVYFVIPKNIRAGEIFEVLINADTGGELINGVDMEIGYPKDLMSFAGYKNDDTVIGLWVETPNEKDGQVYFKGIIPGGASGLYDPARPGLAALPIARLIFRAKIAGDGTISFVESSILKNDGTGTPLKHDKNDAEIIIGNAAVTGEVTDSPDKTPPEPFNITLVPSSVFSRTPSMIIFNTDDGGSGIKKYEMTTNGGSSWENTYSPQPIRNFMWGQTVTVRAFDFYGNFRDAEIRIPSLVSYTLVWMLLAILIFSILGYKLLKYRL
jgi:hypothetical protein